MKYKHLLTKSFGFDCLILNLEEDMTFSLNLHSYIDSQFSKETKPYHNEKSDIFKNFRNDGNIIFYINGKYFDVGNGYMLMRGNVLFNDALISKDFIFEFIEFDTTHHITDNLLYLNTHKINSINKNFSFNAIIACDIKLLNSSDENFSKVYDNMYDNIQDNTHINAQTDIVNRIAIYLNNIKLNRILENKFSE